MQLLIGGADADEGWNLYGGAVIAPFEKRRFWTVAVWIDVGSDPGLNQLFREGGFRYSTIAVARSVGREDKEQGLRSVTSLAGHVRSTDKHEYNGRRSSLTGKDGWPGGFGKT